jgi:O-acetylserine/cysteine efflux transporter
MSFRDLILILLVALVWGANVPLSAIAVKNSPPVFFVLLRFIILALIFSPKLFPLPKQMGMLFLVSLCMGGLSFIAQFVALLTTSASNLAIIAQLSLPLATILSIIFLHEKVRWKRGLGMFLAFSGVIFVIYKPEGIDLNIGNILAFASALLAAIGTVLMKKLDPIEPLRFQAWNSLFSLLPLLLYTVFLEKGQFDSLSRNSHIIASILVFSVIFVSIYGHTTYFHLIKKYEVTQIMPFTLMTPVWAVLLSSVILHEKITLQIIVGGLISIAGVALIAMRDNASLGKNTATTITKI